MVALLGLANAGKSTLLNRWLGEKLAIVTAKPQTTRGRLLGILSRPGAQLLLLDTPGLVPGRRGALDQSMGAAVREAAADCDVALLLVELGRGWQPAHEALLALAAGRPVLLVGTKADLRPGAPWPPPEAGDRPSFRVSAATGEGCPALLEAVVARLPEGPALYPEDELTDRPLRFLAAELVREAAFEALAEEVPYGVAVEVESFDESRPDLVRIAANLLVERESHKRIAVGAGGAKVREIGTRARRELERLVDRHVHLALRVVVEPDWARRPKRLKSLGYF